MSDFPNPSIHIISHIISIVLLHILKFISEENAKIVTASTLPEKTAKTDLDDLSIASNESDDNDRVCRICQNKLDGVEPEPSEPTVVIIDDRKKRERKFLTRYS